MSIVDRRTEPATAKQSDRPAPSGRPGPRGRRWRGRRLWAARWTGGSGDGTGSPPLGILTRMNEIMESNDPTATVKRLFSAFRAGDLDALMATVHPDSRWTYYGANPRLSSAEFGGTAAVRRFFARILERLDMREFNTDEFIEAGDTVVIFGSEAGTVRATGKEFRNVWSQKYVVRENRVVEMVEYNIQVEPGE